MESLSFRLKLQWSTFAFLIFLCGTGFGLLWNIPDTAADTPLLSSYDSPTLPVVEIVGRTESELTLVAKQDLRLHSGDAVLTLTVDEEKTLALIDIPQSLNDSPVEVGGCLFVSRSTGSVYYRDGSSQAKSIPNEKRRCFGSETAAQEAGFEPSKSL